MGVAEIALLVVGAVFAVSALAGIKIKWDRLEREYQRDLGWHLMWTERIMDESDGRSGPP